MLHEVEVWSPCTRASFCIRLLTCRMSLTTGRRAATNRVLGSDSDDDEVAPPASAPAPTPAAAAPSKSPARKTAGDAPPEVPVQAFQGLHCWQPRPPWCAAAWVQSSAAAEALCWHPAAPTFLLTAPLQRLSRGSMMQFELPQPLPHSRSLKRHSVSDVGITSLALRRRHRSGPQKPRLPL